MWTQCIDPAFSVLGPGHKEKEDRRWKRENQINIYPGLRGVLLLLGFAGALVGGLGLVLLLLGEAAGPSTVGPVRGFVLTSPNLVTIRHEQILMKKVQS